MSGNVFARCSRLRGDVPNPLDPLDVTSRDRDDGFVLVRRLPSETRLRDTEFCPHANEARPGDAMSLISFGRDAFERDLFGRTKAYFPGQDRVHGRSVRTVRSPSRLVESVKRVEEDPAIGVRLVVLSPLRRLPSDALTLLLDSPQ